MAFINSISVSSRTTFHRPQLCTQRSTLPRVSKSHRPRGPQMLVVEATCIDDMDKILASADESLVVVDFSTSWCGPCKIIAPIFEELSQKYEDVVFVKVMGDETEEARALMRREGITAVPAFHFWKNNEKVKFFTGSKPEALEKTIMSFK